MTTEEEKIKLFSEYMQREYMRLYQARGINYSRKDFAADCRTPQSNMVKYLNGDLLPSWQSAYNISQFLGQEIFDILEYPAPMPNEFILNKVVRNWHLLQPDQRKDIERLVEKFTAKPK